MGPRVVTAATLFDGHDASINVMRRLLQRHGAEVVHLGHNRSVDDVVAAVVEEDQRDAMVARLQAAALDGENVFAVLMGAVPCCSLGQITDARFEVGGSYRRNV